MENIKEVIDKIENSNWIYQEQIRFLKTERCKLLEEIHKKQQLLDQIDYYIYEINKKKNLIL